MWVSAPSDNAISATLPAALTRHRTPLVEGLAASLAECEVEAKNAKGRSTPTLPELNTPEVPRCENSARNGSKLHVDTSSQIFLHLR